MLQGNLAAVAEYLSTPVELPGMTAEESAFRPGWEDIFRMNQKQLEAAIRRVSKVVTHQGKCNHILKL